MVGRICGKVGFKFGVKKISSNGQYIYVKTFLFLYVFTF